MAEVLFPKRPDRHPMIYAYRDVRINEYSGFLKIGYTSRDVETRVKEDFGVVQPDAKPYEIVFAESSMRPDGTSFIDRGTGGVHERLRRNGFRNVRGEWYECTADDVRNAWMEVRDRTDYETQRTQDFKMRPEQVEAVAKTVRYFHEVEQDSHLQPRFLWNCKMRFGKTFATYELAKKMGMHRVLVMTFKPAVEDAWENDLKTHIDFAGWQFVYREGTQYEDCDVSKPIVCFGSFQDFLQYDRNTGGIKARNEWVHLEDWDMVVFDEYHFGAWRENAKKLFDGLTSSTEDDVDDMNPDEVAKAVALGTEQDENNLPITSKFYLYLSGTPFRALNSGEFIEEQVYSWTYSDEQREKRDWPIKHPGEMNPYAYMPRIELLTYKVPDEITRIARDGEHDEFDLNEFFKATGRHKRAKFVYEEYVQKWLDLIRNAYLPQIKNDLRVGRKERPPMPFSDVGLLSALAHTLWFLPGVSSCEAMENLLKARRNRFYHDYEIVNASDGNIGVGTLALYDLQDAMGDPTKTKTITLSCGKLTTGVTVKPWGGVLMLRNLRSPETYFQTAFRVQSAWTVAAESISEPDVDMKPQCYIFDFALNRALTMVSDYSTRLQTNLGNPETAVSEFIKFLPILAFDGATMKRVNAVDILDMVMAGTSATLLAQRWESSLLVHVDNETLRRLLNNEQAMKALMNIEGFRSLNADLEAIVNRSEAVKKTRKEAAAKDNDNGSVKDELDKEEKELKNQRAKIQKKLIKFATRIPVFMYLTDFREACLKDVITRLEPTLFRRVTGLEISDFELLCSIGVFDEPLMNDAVYKFRRYEESSLSYAGINRHLGERVGLFDTSLSAEDYEYERQRDMLVGNDGLILTSE